MSGSWADAAALLGVHRPGTSWLHRLPAGPKTAGLLVAIAVVLALDAPVAAATGALVSVLVLASTRVPWRPLLPVLRAATALVLVLGAVQVLVLGWEAAVVGVSRVVACLALAWAVSLTTPVSQMLDLLRRVLRPLRVVGVDPERVAMTVTLALRAVPLVVNAAAQADQARRARGARPSVQALAVPTVVRSVRIADGLGEALLARGYPPEAAPPPEEPRGRPA